jgi:hypothetical protein
VTPGLVPRHPSDAFALLAAFPESPERDARLALLAAAPGFDPTRAGRRAIDWGLAPLLSRTLARHPAGERFSPEAREHLALVARLTGVRNALLLHHLRAIGRRFAEPPLPFLVLKGADLMQTVYPDPGCRVSVDLDLLVARPRIDEAEARLRAAGWTPALAVSRDWFDRNLHHGVPWTSPDGAVTLELHWELVRPGDPFPLDAAAVFERTLPFPAAGITARRLAPADLLDHLAAHVLRHLHTPDGAYRSLVDVAWVRAACGPPEHPGVALALALDWVAAQLGGAPPPAGDDPVRAAGRHLLARLPSLPVRQAPAVANGVIGLAERGAGARLRFLAGALLARGDDAARDLTPEQARQPGVVRLLSRFRNFAGETRQLGPRGLVAAWRLGRFRRLLAATGRTGPRNDD